MFGIIGMEWGYCCFMKWLEILRLRTGKVGNDVVKVYGSLNGDWFGVIGTYGLKEKQGRRYWS